MAGLWLGKKAHKSSSRFASLLAAQFRHFAIRLIKQDLSMPKRSQGARNRFAGGRSGPNQLRIEVTRSGHFNPVFKKALRERPDV